jgi:hypothetical protein
MSIEKFLGEEDWIRALEIVDGHRFSLQMSANLHNEPQ